MSAQTALVEVRWVGPAPRHRGGEFELGASTPLVRQAVLGHYRSLPTISIEPAEFAYEYFITTASSREDDAYFTGEFVAQIVAPFAVRVPFTEDGGLKVVGGRMAGKIL